MNPHPALNTEILTPRAARVFHPRLQVVRLACSARLRKKRIDAAVQPMLLQYVHHRVVN